jgi:hypothetical protein
VRVEAIHRLIHPSRLQKNSGAPKQASPRKNKATLFTKLANQLLAAAGKSRYTIRSLRPFPFERRNRLESSARESPSFARSPLLVAVPSEAPQERRMAERGGFEPPIPCGIRAFQARAFDHSATSPGKQGRLNKIRASPSVNGIPCRRSARRADAVPSGRDDPEPRSRSSRACTAPVTLLHRETDVHPARQEVTITA